MMRIFIAGWLALLLSVRPACCCTVPEKDSSAPSTLPSGCCHGRSEAPAPQDTRPLSDPSGTDCPCGHPQAERTLPPDSSDLSGLPSAIFFSFTPVAAEPWRGLTASTETSRLADFSPLEAPPPDLTVWFRSFRI